MQNQTRKIESVLFLMLCCFSFGGAIGRLLWGIGPFDIIVVVSLIYIFSQKSRNLIIDTKATILFSILLFIGVTPYITAYQGDTFFKYFNMELRLFIYLPLVSLIACNLELDTKYIQRILPKLIVLYIFVWLLNIENNIIFRFFNSEESFVKIGDQLRINGPSAVSLTLIIYLLAFQNLVSRKIILLYSFLILLEFIKSGGRTYLVYQLTPILILFYKEGGNIKKITLIIPMLLFSLFIFQNYVSNDFIERFMNIFSATEDHSFNYRMMNIDIMLNRIYHVNSILWGNGIGSEYNVNLFGWKKSFFLDNTFVTLIFKTGLIGLLSFIFIFLTKMSKMKNLLILAYTLSICLIGSISYHLILNPIFIFGFFILVNNFSNSKAA